MRSAKHLADDGATDRLWAQFQQREPTIDVSSEELDRIALMAEPATDCDQPWKFEDI